MEDLGIMEAEAEVDIMVEAVVMEEEEVDSLSRINTKVHTRIKVITAVDTRIRFSSRAIFSVGIARSLGTWRVSAVPNKRMSRNQNLQDVEEESMLFMTRSTCTSASDVVWFLDSGCSNHMAGTKSLFNEIDGSKKSEVRLGDDKTLKVEGKRTIAIKTERGDAKVLYVVQYVPGLVHKLLSVEQLLTSGYKVVFDDDACEITDKKRGQVLALIHMTCNKMFPLDVLTFQGKYLVAQDLVAQLKVMHRQTCGICVKVT